MHTLVQAFPHIAAQIDAARPILAQAIPHLHVATIEDNKVVLVCNDPPTSELLSSSSQGSYFAALFNTHFGRPISLELNHLPPGTQLEDFIVCKSPPLHPSTTPPASPKRTANALTFRERQALQTWMSQPDNTHFVAHESDTDAARQATQDLRLIVKGVDGDYKPVFPDLTITPANIGSMRKLLGIEKVKPEKPAPLQLPDGLTLADLQARIQAHEERLDDLRVQAAGIKDLINMLHKHLKEVIEHVQTLTPGVYTLHALPPLPSQPGQ